MPVHPCANIVVASTQMPIIATSTQMPTRFPEKILGGIFSSGAETIAHQPQCWTAWRISSNMTYLDTNAGAQNASVAQPGVL